MVEDWGSYPKFSTFNYLLYSMRRSRSSIHEDGFLKFDLFSEDVSTGSLIVASLCRFIETQLMKPPPMHSKDLHSTVKFEIFLKRNREQPIYLNILGRGCLCFNCRLVERGSDSGGVRRSPADGCRSSAIGSYGIEETRREYGWN